MPIRITFHWCRRLSAPQNLNLEGLLSWPGQARSGSNGVSRRFASVIGQGSASCSLLWRWRYKTAVHAFSVYAVALYLDLPLFAFI